MMGRNAYRRASWFEVFGIACLAFFIACGFAGCSLLFPPLLILSLPAILLAPALAAWQFKGAVKGPCPYCGARCGPASRPFNCRSCKRRVLVTPTSLSRIPD